MRFAGRLSSTAAARAGAVVLLAVNLACTRSSQRSDGRLELGGPNPIPPENLLPGTDAWAIAKHAPAHQIEGYASATSVAPGQTLELKVNVSRTADVTVTVYRLGHYQGHGAREVLTAGPAQVQPQAPCAVDEGTGAIACSWTTSFAFVPDTTWVTGHYLAKLTRDDGYEAYAPFTVLESSRNAPLLVQASVTTWQAYNTWGGASLYSSSLPPSSGFSGSRAYAVSFDRPYVLNNGASDLLSYEQYMIRWIESRGYDVAYVTNIDIDADPSLLRNRKGFMTVGHDEYWTAAERNAVEAARDAGVSLGFFSADTAYWQIRLDATRRNETCYKSGALDPLGRTAQATVRWRDPPLNRPEAELVGVMYVAYTTLDGFKMRVLDASHWIYAGTGVSTGDTLPNIVGYEWDDVAPVSPSDIELVADSLGVNTYGASHAGHSTVYYPTPSSIVFGSGTIEWGWGLSRPGYADARVQRMTDNILARMGGVPGSPPAEVTGVTVASDFGTAASVTALAGGNGAGYRDGLAVTAQFDAPAGVAAGPDGTLYIADSHNHRIRALRADGTVFTLAGCSHAGYADGTGSAACFDTPTGITVDGAGVIYISDSANCRIRAITLAGVVSTYAGNGGAGFHDDPDPLAASFAYPRGLAVGPDGALYVADGRNAAIRRISSSGVSTIAKQIDGVSGVIVDSDGTVYLLSNGGVGTITGGSLTPIVGARFGDQSGFGDSAAFRAIEGIALYGGKIVFSDSANQRIRAVSLGASPEATTLVGDGEIGAAVGTGATARLSLPRGIAAYAGGLAVADSGNNRVLIVRP